MPPRHVLIAYRNRKTQKVSDSQALDGFQRVLSLPRRISSLQQGILPHHTRRLPNMPRAKTAKRYRKLMEYFSMSFGFVSSPDSPGHATLGWWASR